MPISETNAVLRLQAGHRSIRRYTGEPIPEALLAELIRAGQCAASSSFIHRARGNNARRSDWSATTARAVQGKKREHLLPFLQRLGFFRR
jgi:nitroreductase